MVSNLLLNYLLSKLKLTIAQYFRSGILRPDELIICASPILDRTSFISKKRTLILTDYPRLICIKETDTKVTLKSEVIIITSPVSSNGTKSNWNSNVGKLVFVKAEIEGERNFLVKTVIFFTFLLRIVDTDCFI